MTSPYVYDKADYHLETIRKYGLPIEHSYNHTTFYIKWLINNDLIGSEFIDDFGDDLMEHKNGVISVNRLYEIIGRGFFDDMLSKKGNDFTMCYFNFDNGKYLNDYCELLQGNLQSEFHVKFTDENYEIISSKINSRYKAWQEENI